MPARRRRYSLVRTLSPDLVVLRRTGFDGRDDEGLWTRVTLRKDNQCALSRAALPKGSDAFAPAKGTEMFRAERISADIVDRAVAAAADAWRRASAADATKEP